MFVCPVYSSMTSGKSWKESLGQFNILEHKDTNKVSHTESTTFGVITLSRAAMPPTTSTTSKQLTPGWIVASQTLARLSILAFRLSTAGGYKILLQTRRVCPSVNTYIGRTTSSELSTWRVPFNPSFHASQTAVYFSCFPLFPLFTLSFLFSSLLYQLTHHNIHHQYFSYSLSALSFLPYSSSVPYLSTSLSKHLSLPLILPHHLISHGEGEGRHGLG